MFRKSHRRETFSFSLHGLTRKYVTCEPTCGPTDLGQFWYLPGGLILSKVSESGHKPLVDFIQSELSIWRVNDGLEKKQKSLIIRVTGKFGKGGRVGRYPPRCHR